MWIYANGNVCDFVHKRKSVCLSVYMKRIHVYLLLDLGCDGRRSSVIVYNAPGCLVEGVS